MEVKTIYLIAWQIIRKFTITNTTLLPIDASSVTPFVSGLYAYGTLNIDKYGFIWTMNYNELIRISPDGTITTMVLGLIGPYNGVESKKSGTIFFSDYGAGEIFMMKQWT